MTIPNVEHLLDQANRLIAPAGRGAARQVDLRRAISNAYYAVFHGLLAAAADEFIGRARRHSADYDPVIRLKRSDATVAVEAAHSALSRFRSVSGQRRRVFLALLLFPPR